jgi:sulfite reductase (ferredoxin)
MLLVTRGAEPKTVNDTFTLFIRNFIDDGLVDDKFRAIIEWAQKGEQADFSLRKTEILALADAVIDLYQNMDDSLQFKNIKAKSLEKEPEKQEQPAEKQQDTTTNRKQKDLRGVACPMNFVQTKIQLSAMQPGDELEVLLDDGQPINNVPGSVRGEGHTILEQTPVGDYWKIVIKKK